MVRRGPLVAKALMYGTGYGAGLLAGGNGAAVEIGEIRFLLSQL
jgi:hypothetical protein